MATTVGSFLLKYQRYEAVNCLHEKSACGCPVECRGITPYWLTFTSTPVPKAGAFNDSYVVELRLERGVVQPWATLRRPLKLRASEQNPSEYVDYSGRNSTKYFALRTQAVTHR